MFTIRRGEYRLSPESSVLVKVFVIDKEGFEQILTAHPLYKVKSGFKKKEDIFGNREFIEEFKVNRITLRYIIILRSKGRIIEMIKVRVEVNNDYPEKELYYKDKLLFKGRAKFFGKRHRDLTIVGRIDGKGGLLI